jgi:NAD-dependent DNA ligase
MGLQANKTSLKEKKVLYVRYKRAYYNGKALVSDAVFDRLEDEIRAQDPKWSELTKTGVRVENKKTEVELERFMPSLGKCYPEHISKWLAKYPGPKVVMDKLDGSSLQLVYNKGKPVKLITRGNGTMGGDISFFIPHLSLPKIPYKERLVFRCEALIPVKTFKAKYATKFENARAMVNGMLNRKTPGPALADIHIVVLGLYDSTLGAGIPLAAEWGFKTVRIEPFSEKVAATLASRLKSSVYEMDGLVIADAKARLIYENADKPKWITAYKENESVEDATSAVVKKIIYQTSRLRRIIPKIKLEPVKLGGVTVEHATCHNAVWMADRKIGPGAVVKIVRSGDVIPKIVGVVKAGKTQLPTVPYKIEGVHFVATEFSKETSVREVMHFMSCVGIEFLGKATIEMLHDEGLERALDYLKLWSEGVPTKLTELGVGKAMTKKIWAEFDREFNRLTLKKLMVASSCFDAGVGDRRVNAIEQHYEDPAVFVQLIQATNTGVVQMLQKVPKFGPKTVDLFSSGLVIFRLWLKEAQKYVKIKRGQRKMEVKPSTGKLLGKIVSFTTYRDKAHEQFVTENGGTVDKFGATTTILLYKKGGRLSSKLDKARAKGVEVLTFEEFRKQFKL